MGLFDLFKRSKPKALPDAPTPPSEFDKAIISLEINGATSLFILLAEDGTVNRIGDGTEKTGGAMYIGLSAEPLFSRFIARITPEMLRCQGAYVWPERKGLACELLVMLGYRGSKRTAGFKFSYGSESKGPAREIAELVRYALELTNPWFEEQKGFAKKQ